MNWKPVVWIVMLLPSWLGAQSLWDPTSPGWFTGRVQLQVGDVLHITFDMETSLSLSSQKSTEKNTTFEFSQAQEGGNPLDFLPVLKAGETFSTKENQTLKVKDTLAVRVIEVLAAGLVRIEGRRTRNFSGGEELVLLTGVVDTRDLKGRTGALSKVAELKFSYILPVDRSASGLTPEDLQDPGLSEERRRQFLSQYYNRFLGTLFPGQD